MVLLALSLVLVAAISSPRPEPPQARGGVYPSEEALRRYAQGRMLEERNEGGAAIGEYVRALVLDARSLAAARRLSELAARTGDAPQSLEFADRALTIEPGDAHALWLRGSALFNLGRAAEALRSLEAAVAADSGRIDYLKTLARVGEELDRFEVVARAHRRVIELDDEDGESWFQLAAAEARLGRFSSAKRAVAEAISINPMRPGSLFLQGWIEEGLGDPGKAIGLYQRHLAIHGGDDLTRRRLANLLAAARRFPEALRESQRLSRTNPRDAETLAMEADLAFRLGRAADGERALERLSRLAPDDPENVRQQIEVLARHRRSREGVGLAEAWGARHPGDFRGAMLLARARFLDGKTTEALREAERSVSLAPDSLSPRVLLGRLHQYAQQWRQAAEIWSGIHARDPERWDVALDLAHCRERMGDLEGAEEAARSALSVVPENASALNFLGYLLADHDRKLEEAHELVRRAVALEPENGAFVDSMGWVYFRLGRLEDARRELERAVRLTGGDPVVREHLGDVYKALRLPDLAREQYRMGLASDASNPRLRSKIDDLP